MKPCYPDRFGNLDEPRKRTNLNKVYHINYKHIWLNYSQNFVIQNENQVLKCWCISFNFINKIFITIISDIVLNSGFLSVLHNSQNVLFGFAFILYFIKLSGAVSRRFPQSVPPVNSPRQIPSCWVFSQRIIPSEFTRIFDLPNQCINSS